MQSLKKRVAEFKKAAGEAHQLNQRMTGLYEDMGHILNRYYEISEDAGDMDNDGIQEPDDEEYLQNKRDAITKAVKSETIGDQDGLAPNSPAQDGDDMKEGLDNDKGPDKDGNGNRDQYASSDGDEMKESSQSNPLNVDGHNQNGNWPSKDGEELKELKRSLKDVGGVVGLPALGQFVNKFRK